MKDCRERSKTSDSVGSESRSEERGIGAKAALVMKSKSHPHSVRRISAVHWCRPVCNQEIIPDSRRSEQVVLDVNLFISLEQAESTWVELVNGIVVIISGKGSMTTGTGIEWYKPGTVYYIPSLQVIIMSCSRRDKNGATTSIAKGHCSLYYRKNNNELLSRVTKRELDGLYIGRMLLPRKIMSGSVPTIIRSRAPVGLAWRREFIWHCQFGHASPDSIKHMRATVDRVWPTRNLLGTAMCAPRQNRQRRQLLVDW